MFSASPRAAAEIRVTVSSTLLCSPLTVTECSACFCTTALDLRVPSARLPRGRTAQRWRVGSQRYVERVGPICSDGELTASEGACTGCPVLQGHQPCDPHRRDRCHCRRAPHRVGSGRRTRLLALSRPIRQAERAQASRQEGEQALSVPSAVPDSLDVSLPDPTYFRRRCGSPSTMSASRFT